jgi:hypothetical protein
MQDASALYIKESTLHYAGASRSTHIMATLINNGMREDPVYMTTFCGTNGMVDGPVYDGNITLVTHYFQNSHTSPNTILLTTTGRWMVPRGQEKNHFVTHLVRYLPLPVLFVTMTGADVFRQPKHCAKASSIDNLESEKIESIDFGLRLRIS